MGFLSFLKELKRRNVYKVGTVYAITAWVIAQVFSIATDAFAAPAWVMKILLIFLIAGFPIALIFAWAFELTPAGLRRTREDSSPNAVDKKNLNLNMWIIGLLVLALLVLGVERVFFVESGFTDNENSLEASVAVLPFADFSPQGDQEYFADGISEEILNALAKVEGLQVVGRTSSFQFKNLSRDLKKIGDSLGVDHILEGSVRKAGDDLRITAQLIRADNGFHIWTETYDRDFSTKNIFEIQDEIAFKVLQAMKVEILPGEIENMQNVPTTNKKAYDLYLKGISKAASFNPEDLNTALRLLDEAIQLDPEFALAYAKKARVFDLLAAYGNITEKEADTEMRESLDWALFYDPGLAEAYAGLGRLHLNEKNYGQALAFTKKAVELKPGDGDIRIEYKKALLAAGKKEKSEEQLFIAYDLNPLSTMVNIEVAMIYVERNNFDLAEKYLLKAIDLQPDLLVAYELLGMIYGLKKNQLDKAITIIHKAHQAVDQKSITLRLLVFPTLDLNLDQVAEHYLKKLLNDFPKNKNSIYAKSYILYKKEKYDEVIEYHEEFQNLVEPLPPNKLLMELAPAYLSSKRSHEFLPFLKKHFEIVFTPDSVPLRLYIEEPLNLIHAALILRQNSKTHIAESLLKNLIESIEDNQKKDEYLKFNGRYFLEYFAAHALLGNKEIALGYFKERAKNKVIYAHWRHFDIEEDIYFDFTKEELAPYHKIEKNEIERQRQNVIEYLKLQGEWVDYENITS